MTVILFRKRLSLIASKIYEQQILLILAVQIIIRFDYMYRCVPHHKLQDADISKGISLRAVLNLPAAFGIQLIYDLPQQCIPEASKPRIIDIH